MGDELQRGERISLIQFGSRCDLYLPLDYKIKVKLGDKVVGGETDRGREGMSVWKHLPIHRLRRKSRRRC